jgi:hypothetical protein
MHINRSDCKKGRSLLRCATLAGIAHTQLPQQCLQSTVANWSAPEDTDHVHARTMVRHVASCCNMLHAHQNISSNRCFIVNISSNRYTCHIRCNQASCVQYTVTTTLQMHSSYSLLTGSQTEHWCRQPDRLMARMPRTCHSAMHVPLQLLMICGSWDCSGLPDLARPYLVWPAGTTRMDAMFTGEWLLPI